MPDNSRDNFLVAAQVRLAGRDNLHLPPLQVSITLIHPEQVARKQRRLLSTGSRPHLQNRVLFVGRILGQQQNLDSSVPNRSAGVSSAASSDLCKLAHVGVDILDRPNIS